MTSIARTERSALCDLALEIGPDAPTLAGDWTVRDLIAHLLIREGSPAALGIVVPQLASVTEWAYARTARGDFAVNVERLRDGPPRWSPVALGPVDAAVNTLEFFVHHEDIRRAGEDWAPRVLGDRAEGALWKTVRIAGRRLVRKADVGVVLQHADTSVRVVLEDAPDSVVVRGLPSELALFVYGRKAHAHVELEGAEADVARLMDANLGV